eukprot:sb/3473088/
MQLVNPCWEVSGSVTGHKVMLVAQPYPLGEGFCVDSNIDGFSQLCNVNEFKYCDDGVDGSTFQFSCYQQSCEKQGVNLFVKMVVSDSDDAGEIEYWCDSTNDTYPSSLIRSKPEVQPVYEGKDPSQTKEKYENGDIATKVSLLALVLGPLFLSLFF